MLDNHSNRQVIIIGLLFFGRHVNVIMLWWQVISGTIDITVGMTLNMLILVC
jgi:hypothetical protein